MKRQKTKKEVFFKVDEICDYIVKKCCSRAMACAMCDLSKYTLTQYITKYHSVRMAIEKAEAIALDKLIDDDFKKSEKGKIFLLSRLFPKNFGKLAEYDVKMAVPPDLIDLICSKAAKVEDKLDEVNKSLLLNHITRSEYDVILKMLKTRHAAHFKLAEQALSFDFDALSEKLDKEKPLKV